MQCRDPALRTRERAQREADPGRGPVPVRHGTRVQLLLYEAYGNSYPNSRSFFCGKKKFCPGFPVFLPIHPVFLEYIFNLQKKLYFIQKISIS